MPDLILTKLDDLTAIAVRGTDALQFLHGQLSQDMSRVDQTGAVLAGLHNPQGRCLAVLRILRVAPDQFLLVLPLELAEPIRALLSRYVLRARVTLTDAGTSWRIYGVAGPDAAAAVSTRLSMAMDAGGMRYMVVAPRSEPMPEGEPEPRESWLLEDIRAGLPELRTATSGLFVAQMLNLDLIGAISFQKGCYTGQEVIARAHYRGQVKRRMQRFYTESEEVLAPGARVRLADGRAAQIVMSAPAEDEGQEFLAVTTLPGAVVTAAETSADDAGHGAAWSASSPLLDCEQLPLPYALPMPPPAT
jgi:folate-binding protein YgfZ